MDSSKEKKQTKEVSAEKVHFRVISKHPVYSDEAVIQIKRDMRRELCQILKNYQ